jgi:hypothetical protein
MNDETVPIAEVAAGGDVLLHGLLLALAACVLLLASVLRVRGTEEVVLPICDVPVPGVCSFRQLVGADCPGCGLTRCFVSLAHGDVRRAWHFNPAGVYLFVLVAMQLPYRLLQIGRLRRGFDEIHLGWITTLAVGSLVLALLGQWVARVVAAFL